jgi:hypothetical protein
MMEPKDDMIRIRCKKKTKAEFEKFTLDRGLKNAEDGLQFLMEHYRKTHHLMVGKVY